MNLTKERAIRHGYYLWCLAWHCVQVIYPEKNPRQHPINLLSKNSFPLHHWKGPISSSFVNKYGCRAVTIAGAILAAVCLLASVFAENVLTLIITIGKNYSTSPTFLNQLNQFYSHLQRLWRWMRSRTYLFTGKKFLCYNYKIPNRIQSLSCSSIYRPSSVSQHTSKSCGL